MITYTCQICGKTCTGYPRSRYCVQCRTTVRRETQRKSKARVAEKQREDGVMKQRGTGERPSAPSLGQIAVRTRAQHMSYGEYVAKYGI